ncbi:methyltransferase domain-containing protein [Paenibacillus sp. XY044]|uniref:methyltransferase domain-containing protein n=1 Tax=Paenibacillus sp. XY044 TaxID=2026089 RepID=UPI000B998CB3|nr:methyltransferase domain-containing protein [Paenibacillus sp. XY044]OZB95225.1 stilbene synthase [Paenibacillus sp. XY044]
MPAIKRLNQRAVEEEYMDDFSTGGGELLEALRHLRRLNRIFGASSPSLYGFKRLWREAGRPDRVSVLDIGAGSGDVNRRILRWAARNGVDVRITLVDITEEACEEARNLYNGVPNISVRCCDLFELPESSGDIVMSSQFLHHFDDVRLPGVVGQMLKASRLGVVISDIHRHWVSWSAVWIVAHLVSGNRYIRHDGPLSVAKGFKSSDWIRLRKQLQEQDGEADLSYSWKPLFRYVAVLHKTRKV